MISGICCREFGLGLGDLLSEDNLRGINTKRRGYQYTCKDSAMIVNNNAMKHDITDDPLLRFFKPGVNYEGYWNNHHVKVQSKETISALRLGDLEDSNSTNNDADQQDTTSSLADTTPPSSESKSPRPNPNSRQHIPEIIILSPLDLGSNTDLPVLPFQYLLENTN